MASINEVYGKEYSHQSYDERIKFLCDHISSNFANLNFQVRQDYKPLFKLDGIEDCNIKQIISKTAAINPDIIVIRLDKDHDSAMLPYFLNIPVEYFRIIDLVRKKIYLVYISVENMVASKEKLEDEVRAKLDVAMPGGGYINHSDHSVPSNVPFENYLYLINILKKYGSYVNGKRS